MLEVKTEKKQNDIANTNHGKRKHTTLTRNGLVRQTGDRSTREQRDDHHPKNNRQRKRWEHFRRIQKPFSEESYNKRPENRHPIEKRRQTDTAKNETGTHSFSKNIDERTGRIDWRGHLEKADKATKNCFLSPAAITIKKDKYVKIALDSRKMNESCIKRKTTMTNMEKLISNISKSITKSNGEIWMSQIDLDYAYGQSKLSQEASRHCVFSIIGSNFTGLNWFKKGFYGLSDIPTVF